jgi:magnesium-transporting ATPase (P-type)
MPYSGFCALLLGRKKRPMLYTGLLHTHSLLRFLVLILLLVVTIKSLIGWIGKQPFTKADNSFSLWLLIVTHTQLLVGLVLYGVSPWVVFSPTTMKDAGTRYWTVEHGVMMILAIILITIGRLSHKKLPNDRLKHQRLFLMNGIALVIIIIAIGASGRGLLVPSWAR